jgi:hypothetical protein
MNRTAAKVLFWVGVIGSASAWVAYAKHPTARNLRRAIVSALAFV